MLSTAALVPLDVPVLLESPVFSLATVGASGPCMNLITFASPVGMRPVRLWAISLWRKTATHAAFVASRRGVLQLLSEEHAPLTPALGGHSATAVGHEWKAARCAELGFEWQGAADGAERVLPRCLAYYTLVQQGELIDAGEHDVAICRVEGAWGAGADELGCNSGGALSAWSHPPPRAALSTRALRDAGLINAAGRAALPEAEEHMRAK